MNKPESKKETIIKVATKLFATKGFDATSVRKIAEKSGLSVPGMFHYFPTKEEILNEIMIGFMDDVYNGLIHIYKSDSQPKEKLYSVCKFYAEHYAGHKDQLTILSTESKSLSQAHKKIFLQKQEVYINALTEIFSDLGREGLLKSLNKSVLAFIFFGMVHWTYQWYNPNGEIGPDELGNILSEVFLRGILKD